MELKSARLLTTGAGCGLVLFVLLQDCAVGVVGEFQDCAVGVVDEFQDCVVEEFCELQENPF